MRNKAGQKVAAMTGADPMTIKEISLKMKAAASVLTDMQLVEALKKMGGDRLPPAETMTRATLIEVYAERLGEEEADKLMDLIGL